MKETYPGIKQSFGLFGLYLLITFVGGLILASFSTVLPQSVIALAGILLTNVLIIVIALNFKEVTADYLFDKEKASPLTYLLGAFFVILLILFVDPITTTIPMPEKLEKIFADLIQRDVWSYLTLAVVAPVTEELLFRRIILTGLEKNYGAKKAILWSAFFFALFHLNPWQGIGAFLSGILLGWLYVKTKDIWLCIFIHFFNNSIAYLAFYFSDNAFFSIVDLTGYDYRLALIMGLSLVGMYFCYKLLDRQFKLKPNEHKTQR